MNDYIGLDNSFDRTNLCLDRNIKSKGMKDIQTIKFDE